MDHIVNGYGQAIDGIPDEDASPVGLLLSKHDLLQVPEVHRHLARLPYSDRPDRRDAGL